MSLVLCTSCSGLKDLVSRDEEFLQVRGDEIRMVFQWEHLRYLVLNAMFHVFFIFFMFAALGNVKRAKGSAAALQLFGYRSWEDGRNLGHF